MRFITQGKTNWKFLLIVIILAIIVGAVILFYQEEKELPQEEAGETELDIVSTTTRTETDYNEDTSAEDWQVYKNEEYGFEMKYPEDWNKKEWPYGKFEELSFDIDFSEMTAVLWQGNFRINISPNPNHLDLEGWMKSYERKSATGANLIQEIINTTLDGEIAKRVSVFDFDSTRIEIITINKMGVYNLSFSDVPEGNDPDNSRHQQIYNQILSTFNFIEAVEPETIQLEIKDFTTDKEMYTSDEELKASLTVLSSGEVDDALIKLTGIKPYSYAYINNSQTVDLVSGENKIIFTATTPRCTSGCGGVYPGPYDLNAEVFVEENFVASSTISITLTNN